MVVKIRDRPKGDGAEIEVAPEGLGSGARYGRWKRRKSTRKALTARAMKKPMGF